MFVTNFRLNFYPGYSQFAPSFPWAYHPPSLSSFSAYLEDRASGGNRLLGVTLLGVRPRGRGTMDYRNITNLLLTPYVTYKWIISMPSI